MSRASRVFAEEPRSCPDREAVRAALLALASDAQSRATLDQLQQVELELEDLGERYRVTVNGRSREYRDPARDCESRAQVAAVFTALTLNPASDEAAGRRTGVALPPANPPAPSPGPPVERAPRVSVAPGPAYRIDVRAGVSYSHPVAAHSTAQAAGVLLRGAFMPQSFGVELGIILPASSAELAVGAARAALLRYPLDVSGRFGFSLGLLDADLEAGAALSLLRLRDESNGAGLSVERLEPSLRLGAGARLRRPRISPALGVFGSFSPMEYALALQPTGVLAHTPGLWAGAWAGLSVQID